MKKFYIHIGMPKAYSSSLQAYISQQVRDDYFFLNQENNNFNDYGFLKKDTYKFGKRPLLNYKLLNDKQINYFRSKINDLNFEKIIVSDESFFGNPYTNFSDRQDIIYNIKSLCVGEIKILISLRNQFNWTKSFYNTSVQQGNHISFKEFICKTNDLSVDIYKLDYLKAIKDFSKAFGEENVFIIFCENKINKYKESVDSFFGFRKNRLHFPKKNQSFPKKYMLFRLFFNKYFHDFIGLMLNRYRLLYFICIFFGYFMEKFSSRNLNYSLDGIDLDRINSMNKDLFIYLKIPPKNEYFY
jgi:hypothetical protein